MSSILDNFAKSDQSKTRIGLITGVVVILAVAGVAMYFAFKTTYKPAFTGLEERDAVTIIGELEKLKFPYKLANGGATILVEESRVSEARLQVMGSDAKISGGMGFEVFDGSDFGMTEFVQKINFQRALQGELSRTIGSLDEVKYARVHLVLAESSLFKKEKSDSSASVTLFLKPHEQLEGKQIRGIQRLVAASVPGLNVDNVTVTDERGILLSRVSGESSDSESASVRLQRRQEVESYLENKIAAILLPTFGKGGASVNVNVELNLDKVKTTNEVLLPYPEGVTGIVRKRETKVSGTKKEASQNNSTEIEYQMGKQVEQTVLATGVIERLTVAVSVPEQTPKETVSKVRDLIAASIGINDTRDDLIVVQAIKPVSPAVSLDQLAEAPSAKYPANSKNTVTQGNEKTEQISDVQSDQVSDEVTQSATNMVNKMFSLLDKGWVSVTGHTPRVSELFVFVLVIFCGILALVIYVTYIAASGNNSTRKLNKQEREELLATVSEWLNVDRKPL